MKLAIVVQSCDKYYDLWDPFYKMFFKYWSDCPFPIYHVSESKTYDHQSVKPFITGMDVEWSGRLKMALNEIKEPYVLLLLDDYILIKKVNNEKIENCIRTLEETKAALLRLVPVPGPTMDYADYENIGLIDKKKEYSISTQATIWDTKVLQDFLIDSETVWDFELKGTERADSILKNFLGIKKQKGINRIESGDYPYTYICTAVYKGKWMREAIKYLKKEKIYPDTTYRKMESFFEQLFRKTYSRSPYIIKVGFDIIKKNIELKKKN